MYHICYDVVTIIVKIGVVYVQSVVELERKDDFGVAQHKELQLSSP